MFGLFYQFLISNKKAGIPGIGIFFIGRKPAKLDFANKVFVGPDFQINFRSEPAGNDSNFYKYVSAMQKIDETEAIRNIDEFAGLLKKNIYINKSIELPAMGRLFQNEVGEFQFESKARIQNYFPDIAAERVVRQNAEHTILVGDTSRTNTGIQESLVKETAVSPPQEKWWIAALVLGIIGVAFLIYHYFTNGSLD